MFNGTYVVTGLESTDDIFLSMSFDGTDPVTYSFDLSGVKCDPGAFPVGSSCQTLRLLGDAAGLPVGYESTPEATTSAFFYLPVDANVGFLNVTVVLNGSGQGGPPSFFAADGLVPVNNEIEYFTTFSAPDANNISTASISIPAPQSLVIFRVDPTTFGPSSYVVSSVSQTNVTCALPDTYGEQCQITATGLTPGFATSVADLSCNTSDNLGSAFTTGTWCFAYSVANPTDNFSYSLTDISGPAVIYTRTGVPPTPFSYATARAVSQIPDPVMLGVASDVRKVQFSIFFPAGTPVSGNFTVSTYVAPVVPPPPPVPVPVQPVPVPVPVVPVPVPVPVPMPPVPAPEPVPVPVPVPVVPVPAPEPVPVPVPVPVVPVPAPEPVPAVPAPAPVPVPVVVPVPETPHPAPVPAPEAPHVPVPSAPVNPRKKGGGGMGSGAIAGIIIGVLVGVVAIAAIAAYFLVIRPRATAEEVRPIRSGEDVL